MSPSRLLSAALLGAGVLGATPGCFVALDDDDSSALVPFAVASPDFLSDEAIDHEFDCERALAPANACGGGNPEIVWEGVPDGTVSFVLIMEDVSSGDTPHWAVLNIPAELDGLDAGISGEGLPDGLPSGAEELPTSATSGYLGSCSAGVDLYRWRLWALSTTLDLSRYRALEDDPETAFATLATDADAARLDRTEMCHVYSGGDTPVGR